MQETLGMEDVLDVLIQLETMGHDHYEKMTGMTEVADLRRLFGILAAQELRHRAIYEEWKQVFTPYSDTPPSEEYLAYANALLTETVSLTEDKGVGSDFASGYRAAVQLEKDTILLLTELKTFLASSHHEQINLIIDQERQHLAYLATFRTSNPVP